MKRRHREHIILSILGAVPVAIVFAVYKYGMKRAGRDDLANLI